MKVKQLSVFVENKQGRLAAICRKLAEHDIDISALSLADTTDFGVLRLIVDQVDKAKEVLREEGVVVKVTDVSAVAMADVPGGAAAVLTLLSEGNIAVEYMYACAGKTTGKALMIFRASDPERAEVLLAEHGYAKTRPADIYRL